MPTYTFTIKSDNEQLSDSEKYSYGYRGAEAIVPDPMPTETDGTEIEVANSNPKIKYKRTKDVGISLQSIAKDVKVPYDVYVLDTEKSAFASLEEFYKQNPPKSSATSASALRDFDSKFKPAIVDLVKDIVITVPSGAYAGGFLAKGGKYDIIARRTAIEIEYGQKVNFGKTFAQRNAEISNAAEKTREETSLAGLRETPVLAKINTAIDDPKSSVASFLVGGKQGKYTAGTPEAILYGNFLAFCDMYGVKETVEQKIDSSAPAGTTAPAASGDTGTGATASTATPAAAVEGVGAKIANELQASLINKLKEQGSTEEGEWAILQGSDFAVEGAATKMLELGVTAIRQGSVLNFESPKIQDTTAYKDNPITKALNNKVLEKLQEGFPGAFSAFVNNPTNADVKAFLKNGHDDKLTDEKDKKTYASLLTFATFMGVEDKFKKIAQGETFAAPPAAPAAAPAAPTTTTPAAEAPSGAAAPSATAAAADAPLGEAEPVKNPTVLYVMIAAADPAGDVAETGKPAKITFKYSAVGDTDDEGAASFSISGDKLDKIIPIKLSAAPDMFKRAAESGDPIRITVEAVPVTGGDAIEKTLTTVIRIPKEGQRASSDPLVFRMGRTLGWSPYEGDKADEGRGGAANFKNQSGEVTQVFWTPGGGVGFSNTNVTVSAMGSTYIFEFPEAAPLIVPVRMQVKNPDALQEGKIMSEARTVPHWIFIRPDAAGDRGGAGGGRGGRGKKGADGAGEAINACVTRIKFETKAKWINLPTILNPKDIVPGSIDIDITRGSGSDLTKMPKNAKKVMCEKDLRAALGSGMSGLNEQLYRSLFVFSEAWDRLGVACWVQSSSVTGRSGVTARRQTQRLGMGY